MAEVVNHSLRHLTPEDIQAMVVYLKSVPAQPADVKRPKPLTGQSAAHRKRAPAGAEALRRRLRQLPPVGRQRAERRYAALRGLRTLNDPQGLNLVRVILMATPCTVPAGIT